MYNDSTGHIIICFQLGFRRHDCSTKDEDMSFFVKKCRQTIFYCPSTLVIESRFLMALQYLLLVIDLSIADGGFFVCLSI